MIRRFGFTVLSMLLSSILVGCAMMGGNNNQLKQAQKNRPSEVTVKQDWGKTVYWVEPGSRRLSEEVFGTPQNPKFTVKEQINNARQGTAEFPEGAPGPVIQLIKDLPILVAAPMKHRQTNDRGTRFTVFTHPTPFSDKATPLGFSKDQGGYFNATLTDNVRSDLPGGPMNTHDKVDFETVFHDPDGNRYRVEIAHVVQPPLPGYETGNGVVMDTILHGNTGTGTPLMPREYTHAAFWAMGKIYVNGKMRGKRLTHLMTTQVVRDKDYKLALDEELPLGSDQRHIGDQPHHTHLMIPPVKPYHPMPVVGTMLGMGPVAPKYAPVPTAYELPNGKTQPFIHVMFEQDRITESRGVDLEYTQ